jgi:hypothetical protein
MSSHRDAPPSLRCLDESLRPLLPAAGTRNDQEFAEFLALFRGLELGGRVAVK